MDKQLFSELDLQKHVLKDFTLLAIDDHTVISVGEIRRLVTGERDEKFEFLKAAAIAIYVHSMAEFCESRSERSVERAQRLMEEVFKHKG